MKPHFEEKQPSQARLERIEKLKEDRKSALTTAERVAITRSIQYEVKMIEKELRR